MKETLQVLNEMQESGVISDYAIGGAVGATFYLEPVATIDIDVFVSFRNRSTGPLISLSPIYDYLTSKGFAAEKEYIIIAGWPVQFLTPGDALVDEALAQAIKTDVEGVPTRVMTAEHLVAICLQVGRPKDYTRILQFVESGILDLVTLNSILQRHTLGTKWEQFVKKFIGET